MKFPKKIVLIALVFMGAMLTDVDIHLQPSDHKLTAESTITRIVSIFNDAEVEVSVISPVAADVLEY